ncbi:HU family DNA-binding protein [Microcoleus sp. F6_B4]
MASVADNITLKEAITTIASSLASGEQIKIEGLGTFSVVDKPERPGRNPRTGEITTYKASRKPKIEFDNSFLKQLAPASATSADTKTKTSAAAPAQTPAAVESQLRVQVQSPVLPPPIPAELIAASQAPLLWQIKAPDNSFVEVPTNELPNWGVGVNTPIYSAATGWKLAGSIPELVGIVK